MIRFMKFCLVGGSNTLIALLTFYLLNIILNINYLLSSLLGYCLGMLNSFILNKKWTFYDNQNIIVPQFIKFAVVNSFSLGVNLVIMYTLSSKFNVEPMLSQILATGFSVITNYTGSKLWVFGNLKAN